MPRSAAVHAQVRTTIQGSVLLDWRLWRLGCESSTPKPRPETFTQPSLGFPCMSNLSTQKETRLKSMCVVGRLLIGWETQVTVREPKSARRGLPSRAHPHRPPLRLSKAQSQREVQVLPGPSWVRRALCRGFFLGLLLLRSQKFGFS